MDEWKRQLHAYKEENQRLKIKLQEIEGSKGGKNAESDASEDLRKEISILKGRIEGLEKDLSNQEVELKAAKISLKDKTSDPLLTKNFLTLFQQFSIHLSDMQDVHKEMDKIFQIHKST